eukprot:Skav227909  [mRNA]  locus=scaffold146:85495:87822:- [translate_table: standard]
MMSRDQGDACQLVSQVCWQRAALNGQGLLCAASDLHHQRLKLLLHVGPGRHRLVALDAGPAFMARAVTAPVLSMLAFQLPGLLCFKRFQLL